MAKEQIEGPESNTPRSGERNSNAGAAVTAQGEIFNLFEENGLFHTHTPPGTEPMSHSMRVLGHLRSDVSMKAYRLSHRNSRQANQLESWAQSLNKVEMAYEVLVYPLLDEAQRRHQRDPFRDPFEHGPASYKASINEGIIDAQVNPNRDLEDFPHRGPININETEMQLLAKVAHASAVPFDSEKRVFRYSDLLPQLEAERQRRWKGLSSGQGSPPTKPPKL